MARTKQVAKKSIQSAKPLASNRELLRAKRQETRQDVTAGVKKVAGKGRQGETALKQIRLYQKSTELLIPKAPFSRVVREVRGCVDSGPGVTGGLCRVCGMGIA
jgi:hypothetical protein